MSTSRHARTLVRTRAVACIASFVAILAVAGRADASSTVEDLEWAVRSSATPASVPVSHTPDGRARVARCVKDLDDAFTKAPELRTRTYHADMTWAGARAKCAEKLAAMDASLGEQQRETERSARAILDKGIDRRENALKTWASAKQAASSTSPESLSRAGAEYGIAARAFEAIIETFERELGRAPGLANEAMPVKGVKATWSDLLATLKDEHKTVKAEWTSVQPKAAAARAAVDRQFKSTLRAKVAGDRKKIVGQRGLPSEWKGRSQNDYSADGNVKSALASPEWTYLSSGDCSITFRFRGDAVVSRTASAPWCK